MERAFNVSCFPVTISALLLALALGACSGAAPDAEPPDQATPDQATGTAPEVAPAATPQDTNLYWGDTHLHTSNSFDVYLFGTPTATPETAYRFAMGLPVISPTTETRWQLSKPLDFLVVADHAEAVGSIPRVFAGDPVVAETKTGEIMRQIARGETTEELQAVYDALVTAASGIDNEYGLTGQDVFADLHAGEKRRTTWDEYIATADRYNQPGVFTALIGWEWSSIPDASNLHRVVFMPQDATVAGQFLPYSLLDSSDPEDLWAWLSRTSAEVGADFVAIPHNPNISMGRMFPLVTLSGDAVDAEYAEARMKWETVVEVTQIKGDSEAHPLLSPTDEFADYETYPFVLTPDGRTPDPTEGDYLRSGLKRGLELEAQIGVNPFKVGMIGSTDSHTGMSAVEETNFAGKGQHDAFPEDRPHPTGLGSSRGWDMGAAGFVGAWAEENTRQGIFEAFRRKEVYASTGPRIHLRFFGGYEFVESDTEAQDLASVGYAKGVPMGGDLAPSPDGSAPTFLIGALMDPMEGNLDRVQIIKGWLDAAGESHERIYDVALADGRTDGSIAVGNTVDLTTGQYTNSIGDPQLATVWRDPDFDPSQRAFYYARVLQIPTPRYSLFDAIALGIDPQETGRPATIQERVYSSPIWYTPGR